MHLLINRFGHLSFAAAVAATLLAPRTLAGQAEVQASAALAEDKVPAGRLPVLVALVDAPRYGTPVVVMRRRAAGKKVDDVILVVNDSAAAGRVVAAAMMIIAVMSDEGDDAKDERLLRVTDDATRPSVYTRGAREALLRAAETPEVNVPGVGKARTTTIYLPDAKLRMQFKKNGRLSVTAKQHKP